jgi:hypothetical protein
MRARNLKPAPLVLLGVALVGTTLTTLSLVSMRMARDRVYAEIAAHCERIGLLTFNDSSYLCAPVAHIERRAPEPPDQSVAYL